MIARGVSAPGKVMLSGEYAVLDGSNCLVSTVTHRAYLRHDLSRAFETQLPRELAQFFNLEAQRLSWNASELQQGETKLGLGSSAAAAACGALMAAGGEVDRVRLFESALHAHRVHAPHGSGADVAAAVFGGTIVFRGNETVTNIETLVVPDGVFVSVVWTGSVARTDLILQQFQARKSDDLAGWGLCKHELDAASDALMQSFRQNKPARSVAAVADPDRAFSTLSEWLQMPLRIPTHQRIVAHAVRCGGAAKPSGAGGGDVSLAMFDNAQARDAFERSTKNDGIYVIASALGAPGVRYEEI